MPDKKKLIYFFELYFSAVVGVDAVGVDAVDAVGVDAVNSVDVNAFCKSASVILVSDFEQ